MHTAYTAATNKNGVASPKEVSAKQIKGIRVRFIPEVHRNVSSQVTTRSMVNESNVFWEELQVASTGDSSSEEGGSGSGGGLDENPLGSPLKQRLCQNVGTTFFYNL